MASVKGRRFVLEMFVAARREIKTLKRGRGSLGSGRRFSWALFFASGRFVAVCVLSPVVVSFESASRRDHGGLLHAGGFKRYQGFLPCGLRLFVRGSHAFIPGKLIGCFSRTIYRLAERGASFVGRSASVRWRFTLTTS